MLKKLRGKHAASFEPEDISKALGSLTKLSSDFKILKTGNKRVIVSTSVDFNSDQIVILDEAEKNGGWITFSDLRSKIPTFNNKRRFLTAIDTMLQDGLGWEDHEPFLNTGSSVGKYTKHLDDDGKVYWFPTLMKESAQAIEVDDEDLVADMAKQ